MDDSLQFSEDDIRQQLDLLGYHNVPTNQLAQFAQDLERLIRNDTESERSKSHEALVTSDSDYSVNDVGAPVWYPRGTSAVSRRPRSAPNTSKAKSPTVLQPTRPAPSGPKPIYPARHPKAFSYKYSDTSTSQDLDTTEESTPGRRSQDRRRSLEKKPAMKRKVVRKMNGQVQIFDESITDSEAGDPDSMSDRLSRLVLRHEGQDTEDDVGDSTLTEPDDASSLMGLLQGHSRRPHTSRDLYSHRPAGDENTVYKPHLPRSFIRPDSSQPRTKHDKKTDPVSRHEMYKAEWSNHRAPGEKNRNDLRWSIREQMMYKDSVSYPKRTPRVHSANNYVVPTNKKRQALRWAVRTSLANKQMPFSTFY